MIGRADFEYIVIKRDGAQPGPGRIKGTNSRIVHWVGSAAEDAGCRAGFEMPETTPLSYQSFTEGLGQTGSVMDEVKALWPVLSDQQAEKALAWLGGSLERADAKKLPEMLNKLRTIKAQQEEKSDAA
jgi:hypothetical protein